MRPEAVLALDALADLAEPFEDDGDGEREGYGCSGLVGSCDRPVTGGYLMTGEALEAIGYPRQVAELRVHLCGGCRCLVVLGEVLGEDDVIGALTRSAIDLHRSAINDRSRG